MFNLTIASIFFIPTRYAARRCYFCKTTYPDEKEWPESKDGYRVESPRDRERQLLPNLAEDTRPEAETVEVLGIKTITEWGTFPGHNCELIHFERFQLNGTSVRRRD